MNELKTFRFWCNKVLPLVYDDSLSYYEVLCKVVDYINKLIGQDKIFGNELINLQNDLNEVNRRIDEFDTEYIERIISEKISTMIMVGINDNGYIVYYIPDNWNDIQFNTTGLDIDVEGVDEYGRLVLSY